MKKCDKTMTFGRCTSFGPYGLMVGREGIQAQAAVMTAAEGIYDRVMALLEESGVEKDLYWQVLYTVGMAGAAENALQDGGNGCGGCGGGCCGPVC